MGVKIITAPAAEPVSLAEAKAHLRLEASTDDTTIAALIPAAREYVETTTGRSLVTRTLELMLNGFPAGPIVLSRAPVQAVSSVTYYPLAGPSEAMDPAVYLVNETDAEIAALRYPWPATAARPDAVRVRYVAGYGDPEDVPAMVKQAILLLVAHWFSNREAVIVGVQGGTREIPIGVGRLLNMAKSWRAV